MNSASRTAVLVCQGRAVADGRIAPDRFHDPIAIELLRGEERELVERVRAGNVPEAFGERMAYEWLRATAEVIVPRTVAIDGAARAGASRQLVILGAGLDSRAWRMPELADTVVWEVDRPASQADKRKRAQGLGATARAVQFVPVDFARDSLDAGLGAAGHDPATPTTWIWEGVVPYLTRRQVEQTVEIVAHRSASGSTLIVNYQAPALSQSLGRLTIRLLTRLARQADPLANEPRRSSWTASAMRDLLGKHGFLVVVDDDLLTLAERYAITPGQLRSLRASRIAVAKRDGVAAPAPCSDPARHRRQPCGFPAARPVLFPMSRAATTGTVTNTLFEGGTQ